MEITLKQAEEKLSKYGQRHLLKFYKELTGEEIENLLNQIDRADMDILEACGHEEEPVKKGTISPLSAMQLDEITIKKAKFTGTGLAAIREGKAAAVMLAGGMGTRLGSDQPKGMYNIGIHKPRYIFECLIRNLLETVNQAGAWIHLLIMTSEKNHRATETFLREHNYFGYKAEYIHFFMQETAVACDYEGKIFLEEKGRLATSPSGNGGWFISMEKNNLLELVHKEGIEWLNVFAVDNVLQRIADPCFLGAVIEENCAVGAKVVRKNAPDEKVGVMCLEDGRPSIVEYYDLTQEMMDAKDEKGDPAYNFGVILNYFFRAADLEKMVTSRMPLHVVEKKIPYIGENGEKINPSEPNGYKFETLVLDMIHYLDTCLPFEVVRNKEFAPVKNKTGIDSVETARKLLEENGVEL